MKTNKKNLFNKEVKFALGLILGLIISGIGVYAAVEFSSDIVTYNNANSTLSATNVQDAIDELYDKASNKDLYTVIATEASSDSVLDYTTTSGSGVYLYTGEQDEGTKPIYFYRGAVTNNNVIFAGFCWKIVRTTGTGGIKLIYNGSPSNNQCTTSTGTTTTTGASAFNSSVVSPSAVGWWYNENYPFGTFTTGTSYYYGSDIIMMGSDSINLSDYTLNTVPTAAKHYTCRTTSYTCNPVYYVYYLSGTTAYYIPISNEAKVDNPKIDNIFNSSNMFQESSNSSILLNIASWYNTNLSSYDSKLENFKLCNDKSISSLGGWSKTGSLSSYLYFSAYSRMTAFSPSLKCENSSDYFTGKYGLITADEVMLAGGKSGTTNSSYYLYNNQSFWTMTPRYFASSSAYMVTISSNGSLTYTIATTTTTRVRPMISLVPNTAISGGTGSTTNPFIVE